MTEHITGQQARELLDGTTPGPWVWDQQLECVVDPPYSLADLHINAEGNGELIAAAPDLAETVAWLYGRGSIEAPAWHGAPTVSLDGDFVAIENPTGWRRWLASPEDAVDFARALLTASEKARRHTD